MALPSPRRLSAVDMADHILPTGDTPIDLSEKSTPSFGTDDSDTDTRRATQMLYLQQPAAVAMPQPASPKAHQPATSSEPSAIDCQGVEFEEFCDALMASHQSVSKVEKKELKSPRTSTPKREQG